MTTDVELVSKTKQIPIDVNSVNAFREAWIAEHGEDSFDKEISFNGEALDVHEDIESAVTEIIDNLTPVDGLEIARKEAIEGIVAFADSVRVSIVGGASPYAVASWPDKAAIAEKVIAETATAAEKVGIEDEATARGRGESVEDLALRQLALAEWYRKAVGKIDGVANKLTDTVMAAETPEEVADALATGSAEATQLIADHVATRPGG